jgi:predicted transcriptional regulator
LISPDHLHKLRGSLLKQQDNIAVRAGLSQLYLNELQVAA